MVHCALLRDLGCLEGTLCLIDKFAESLQRQLGYIRVRLHVGEPWLFLKRTLGILSWGLNVVVLKSREGFTR